LQRSNPSTHIVKTNITYIAVVEICHEKRGRTSTAYNIREEGEAVETRLCGCKGVYLHRLKALKRAGSLHRRQLNGLWPITMTKPNFQHTRRDFSTVLRLSNPTSNCPILLRAFDTSFDGLKFRGGDGQWSPTKTNANEYKTILTEHTTINRKKPMKK
jgi:hypothetical protein